MDILSQRGQGLVDEAVTFQQALSTKAFRGDDDAVVSAVSRLGMAGMLGGVIGYDEVRGRKACSKLLFDGVPQAHGRTCWKGCTTTFS